MSTKHQQQAQAVAYSTTVDGNPALFVSGYVFNGFGLMLAQEVERLASDTGKPVTLYLNSNGGLLAEAFAYYDYIRAKGIAVKVEGFGTIGSAATVVAMASGRDGITLAENTTWFIHRVSFRDEYGDVVTGDDAERDRLNGLLTAAYMEFTGQTAEAINALLDAGDGGVGINASKAVELGFAAGVIPVADSKAAAFRVLQPIASHQPIAPMSTKKVAVKLSLLQAVASLTSEGTTVEVDMEAKAADTIAALTAERDAKATELDAINAKLAAIEAEKVAAEAAKVEAETAATAAATEVTTAKEAVATKTAEASTLFARVQVLEEQLKLPVAQRTVPRAENPVVGGNPNGTPSASDLAAKSFAANFTNPLDAHIAAANAPKS